MAFEAVPNHSYTVNVGLLLVCRGRLSMTVQPSPTLERFSLWIAGRLLAELLSVVRPVIKNVSVKALLNSLRTMDFRHHLKKAWAVSPHPVSLAVSNQQPCSD
jgi:hypothetical protein